MTKKQAIARLQELQTADDPESAHMKADVVLYEFLKTIGHDDVAEAWNEITPKWYA